MYLTTKCQLNCEYCFERKAREGIDEHYSISRESIREYIDIIANVTVPPDTGVMVIQGGEPFTEYELLKYVFEYARETWPEHRFAFNVVTNGVFFSRESNAIKYIDEVLKAKSRYHYITTDISYDRTGQAARMYPNGKSSRDTVESGIENFNKHMPEHLRIRYTVHALNDDPNIVLNDLVEILELYRPQRIVVNNNAMESPRLPIYYEITRKLFEKYGVPFCDYVCDICKHCDKTTFIPPDGEFPRRFYVNPKGKTFRVDDNIVFDHFNR